MTSEVGKRLSFRRQRAEVVDSASPEALFGDLPKLPLRVAPLWGHQTDQLRSYFKDHANSADVALELPTGSGKTLVGLLIAEWRRRHFKQRTVYACPTIQLAEQAAEKANNQGIDVALLTGPSQGWDPRDLHAYERGEKVAVTVYSSIFNSNPKIDDPGSLVFDDAHAAENYVAGAWSIEIDRDEDLFGSLVEVLRPSLDAHLAARLSQSTREAPGVEADVRLIPVTTVLRHEAELEAVLLGGLTDRRKFPFSLVSGHLAGCCFYISGRGVLVRPMIPPTGMHAPFSQAVQRVYLSATLGSAGELERSFGRTRISRIPAPKEYDRTGGGRRFFVFPELSDLTDVEMSSGDLLTKIMKQAPKKVILGQADNDVLELADRLETATEDRFFTKDKVTGRTFKDFVTASKGTLLAPNRYDGMDLKDDACRMLLMDGLPSAMHEQDRFLLSRVHAGEVLAERLRTRIVQGVGRCTRGPKDYSVVVVTDPELTSFLSKEENLRPLPVEIQAEIRFGSDVSHAPGDELPGLVASALAQDELWQREAEPDIVLHRGACSTSQPSSVAVLERSAAHEVKAWEAAWRRDWDAALRHAVEASNALDIGGLKTYRALWAFLASEFVGAQAPAPGSPQDLKRKELLAEAHLLTARATWLREIAAETRGAYQPNELDAAAASKVVELATSSLVSKPRCDKKLNTMLENLASTQATRYETGLAVLGEFLGAESFKPVGKGRTDAVWAWEALWLTLEAKSEQKSNGLLSMEYVRQANTQLRTLAADRETAIPEGSATVVISPRQVVDSDAATAAEEHIYLADPKSLLAIALDTKRAWQKLQTRELSGASAVLEVAMVFWEYRLLPEQLRERLTTQKVN